MPGKKILRKVNLIDRYGGEEFLAILPHAQQEQAKKVAERLRNEIQSLKWGECSINTSVSVGVSEYRGKTIKGFIKKKAKLSAAFIQIFQGCV
ncbi:MAG: diguanylate cyclase [Pelotomaculaceae bacterium]